MAKDTEKLIRQLSLISFLMAQGRPTSALEIKREVEGYSDMNDDAFARRFYADRAELESLGITLQVEKPGESLQGYESELYSLPPENYYLPEIRFGDDELAALQTALHLLDGEFAYAEPLRLPLQQVSCGAKGERAFSPREDFGGRDYARKAEWQLGEIHGTAKVFLKERIAWLVERDFGAYGEFRNPGRGDGSPGKGRIFETEYASSRQMVAWVLHCRQNATVLDPPELAEQRPHRLDRLGEHHRPDSEPADAVRTFPHARRS